MARELTKKEIYERMQEWRNIKKLHEAARARVEAQQETITLLNEEVRLLRDRDKEKDTVIATLKLRIEELERMIFGRRRKKDAPPAQGDITDEEVPRKQANRSRDSYSRRIPEEKEVTRREQHTARACLECGAEIEKTETRTFYEEDIVLPTEDTAPLKRVTRHDVERGWCGACLRWRSAVPLPPTTVVLGAQVKLYICYLSILVRLSFEQVRHLLRTTYHMEVSSGEIAFILEKEATALRPEYEVLKERIRGQRGVHYDETSHPVQREEQGRYAWVMTGTETDDVVFDCGRSRGKGVAEKLKGDADHVGITDDYGAYRRLFREHQLCWAHPNRKLRELTETDTLSDADVAHCRSVFWTWSALYADLRAVLVTPFDQKARTIHRAILLERFDAVAAPNENDPAKLQRIKAALRRGRDAYFTCLLHDGIPCDNNKAERAVRHLVLKRRTSFGSRTRDKEPRRSVCLSRCSSRCGEEATPPFFKSLWR